MDDGMSARSRRLGAYTSTALLVLSWILALALVGMGLANRNSVGRTADAAFRGRALDRAMTAAGTLALLRPAGPARLQMTFEDLVDDRILEAWLVSGSGVVVVASDPKYRGKSIPNSLRKRMRQCRGEHLVHRLGPGRYEVWLPIHRSARAWRRWRRMWRWWQQHPSPDGPGMNVPHHCLADDACPRRREGGGAGPGGGPSPSSSEGQWRPGEGRHPGWGRRRGPDAPPVLGPVGRLFAALGPTEFPYLRFVVVVDDSVIRAALRRSKAVSIVSFIVAVLLMLGSALVFVAGKRNRALEEKLVRHRHLAEIGELATVLAHEIRNPLGVMKGNAQVVAERLGRDAPTELDLIVEQASRLERLVNALLDYARPTTPNRGKVDLGELASRTAELFTPRAWERGLYLVTDIDSVEADVDQDQIQQVIINLLDNALDVSVQTVTLTVKKRGDHALISVEDRGPGISAEVERKIFEPFVTTKARGTGLGLAIARRIVQAHGGRIRAMNVHGKGARFEVHLPLSRA